MSEADVMICARHGTTRAAFACRHVARGVGCGFHAALDADDPWPDAWCDACEERFQVAGEWTDEASAFADIKVMCTGCYEQQRESNLRVPRHARGAAAALSEAEAREFVHRAVHAAMDLQDDADRRWQWRALARWDYDDGTNTLRLSDQDKPTLVADATLIGSYASSAGTFQWAWQTMGDDAPAVGQSWRLRTFGEVRGLAKLVEPNWPATVEDGWECLAVAAAVLGAEALYRAPFRNGQQVWFLLLTNLRIEH